MENRLFGRRVHGVLMTAYVKEAVMETAIKLEGVSKSFGKRCVVDHIHMETYQGEVFGFLGPNGAGKTTTIKMLVGLIDFDEGKISICGQDIRKNFEKAMANVGGIVENPELYKYMTGMQNLHQYARMRKGVTEERINEVIQLVGLSNRIHEKVSKYSLGMRQRLGVAQSLLHHPKVLILDEPTNGLDPAGIRQLRDILRDLAHREKICVLVSSHLMSEMQLMCDRVGIIVKGKLLSVTSVDELVASAAGMQNCFKYHVSDAQAAVRILTRGCRPWRVSAEDDTHFEIILNTEEVEEALGLISKMLVSEDILLYTAAPKETGRLEDAFIELTKGDEQIA